MFKAICLVRKLASSLGVDYVPETPVFMACCLLPFELREGRFSPSSSVDIALAVSRTLPAAGARQYKQFIVLL